MNKTTRYVLINVCVVAWMILTASFVFAQNFSGIISLEDKSGGLGRNVESKEMLYPEVSLIPTADHGSEMQYESVMEAALMDPSIIVESSNYTLGEKDVISILVARHPEVSGEFVINNEGKIQYAFVGDVKLAGMKKVEVKERLTKLLSEYIITPEVTVQITGFNSKIVYVLGEVSKPGKILLFGDTITVREALIQAGLPLESAKASKSRLITPSENGKAKKKAVDVHKLLYDGDLRENHVMKPGDTLYIPPTAMAKAMRVIQPITRPINTVGSTGRRIYTGGF